MAWALAAGLTAAGCGAPPERGTKATKPMLEVAPFEVVGQDEGGSQASQAFARSLASALAPAVSVVQQDLPGASRKDREPGVQPAAAPTHSLTGTLIREGQAVYARVSLGGAATGALLRKSELRSTDGDLSALASRLARWTVQSMDLPYPELYDYIGDAVEDTPLADSPVAARAAEEKRRGDSEGFIETTALLAEQHANDLTAHVLNAWALLQSWDAHPTRETLGRLRDRLAALDQLDPNNPYDDLMRAFVYRSSGEPGRARVLYSRVLARADLSSAARAWALRQSSLASLQIGDVDAARRDAEDAVARDPAKALNLIALSKSLEALGRLDEAAEAAQLALTLEPLQWRHHQRLGLVYSRGQRLDEAVNAIARACELSDNPEPCANLAVTLLRAGRSSEARAAAAHTRTLAGTPWGFYNLGCYLALAQDKAGAIDALHRSLDLGYADALIDADPDYDSLRGDPAFEAIVAEIDDRLTTRRQLSNSVFPWQG